MWRDDELVAQEEHLLRLTLYFKEELLLLLERAGFVDVDVRGQYNDAAPTPEDDFLVFRRQEVRLVPLPLTKPPKAIRPISAMMSPSQRLQMSATMMPMITRIPPSPMPFLIHALLLS